MADGFDHPFDGRDVDDLELKSLAILLVGMRRPIGDRLKLGLQVSRKSSVALLRTDALTETDVLPHELAVLTVIELRRRVCQNFNLHTIPLALMPPTVTNIDLDIALLNYEWKHVESKRSGRSRHKAADSPPKPR